MHLQTVRESWIEPFAILDLRPTQMTIGMHEVETKRQRWRAVKRTEDFLGKHLIPVIYGPKVLYYIIDHHHLARVLYEEGVKNVGVTVVANSSQRESFAPATLRFHRYRLHAAAKPRNSFALATSASHFFNCSGVRKRSTAARSSVR